MPSTPNRRRPEVDVMDDESAIRSLLARYCELYDDGDLEGYAALFAHGSIRSPGGVTHTGTAAVLAHQRANCIMYSDGTPRTSHAVSNVNVSVEVAGDGRSATARCSFTVFQATGGFPLQPISAGRYLDVLQKIDGVWWFAERIALMRLVGDLSRHWRIPVPPTETENEE
jgi:hypothetical protein